MGFLDFIKSRGKKSAIESIVEDIPENSIPNLDISLEADGRENQESLSEIEARTTYSNFWTVSFDGEKNSGEVGPIVEYDVDYYALATRSWKLYLDSEVSKIIFDKYAMWIIGKGLRLDSNPIISILKSEGFDLNTEEFNGMVEDRFKLFSKSKRASHDGEKSLMDLQKIAFKSAKIGGDVLTILRTKGTSISIQLIDGTRVRGNDYSVKDKNKGTTVEMGVETNSRGKHIAYHVIDDNGASRRIKAYSPSGHRVAFLYCGSEYRIGAKRGIPQIAASMESMSKMDRYKEAAVGSAEERQKLPFFIEHNQSSDGENPMTNNIASMVKGKAIDPPATGDGVRVAKTIAASMNKNVYNMPIGSKISVPSSDQELHYKEFYGTSAEYNCAAVGIPPNVAFSLYTDSFSASRAATKDWEHSMGVERDGFDNHWLSYVYEFWFFVQVLNDKIKVRGYLKAWEEENFDIIESLLQHRYIGVNFPHIDPAKEVSAARMRLGKKFDHVPLSDLQQETEALFTGDSKSNIDQAAKELDYVKKAGIEELSTGKASDTKDKLKSD